MVTKAVHLFSGTSPYDVRRMHNLALWVRILILLPTCAPEICQLVPEATSGRPFSGPFTIRLWQALPSDSLQTKVVGSQSFDQLGHALRVFWNANVMLVSRGACARSPTLARHLRLQLVRYSKREQLHEPHTELLPGHVHLWWMRPDEVSSPYKTNSMPDSSCWKPYKVLECNKVLQSAQPPDCHTPQDSSELSDIADPATRRIRKLARSFLRSTLARQAA